MDDVELNRPRDVGFCRWQDVVRDCNTVLGLPSHSQNIKALFRRSLARRELGEEEQAGAVQGGSFDVGLS